MLSRRGFLAVLSSANTLIHLKTCSRNVASAKIDRKALVDRHAHVLRRIDPASPFSLGNGEFAFTADVTGLQTFAEETEPPMLPARVWRTALCRSDDGLGMGRRSGGALSGIPFGRIMGRGVEESQSGVLISRKSQPNY